MDITDYRDAVAVPAPEAVVLAEPVSAIPANVARQHAPVVRSRLANFYELTKPRLNFLVIVTTLVGFCVAAGAQFDPMLLLHTLLGTAMCAAAASVLNQLIESNYDAKMRRTRNRPLPCGGVAPAEAMFFGITLGVFGSVYLFTAVNPLTAGLGMMTMMWYLGFYTPMKRLTTLNTIIGAVPGALPPVMGFTAAQNHMSPGAVAIFLILFFWQMPHFLAIAIMYKDDYTAGGFKMLPCVPNGVSMSSRQILLWSMMLIPISLLPTLVGVANGVYFFAALLLGLGFLYFAVICATTHTRADARKLFFASIIYLPLVLAAMVIGRA